MPPMSNVSKNKVIFIALSYLFVGQAVAEDRNCNIERFVPIYNTLTFFPNDLVKYKFEIADAENKLIDLKSKLNQNSISANFIMEGESQTEALQSNFDSGKLTKA